MVCYRIVKDRAKFLSDGSCHSFSFKLRILKGDFYTKVFINLELNNKAA